MAPGERKDGNRPSEGPGEPKAPQDPRRPASADGGQGPDESGSTSLVYSSNKSTGIYPDLRYRMDDVGRGFLYEPVLTDQAPPPPVNTGPRRTTHLSARAARQIKGAALKADKLGFGLRTFITFTVREEERAAFESGQFILGREMRRVINALNEWFKRRGMPLLVYVWVAENKRNKNPHVHLLTNHRVPFAAFQVFAAHVEKLWGHGFAHIETIREPKQAGRYLLKAVGYALKGQETRGQQDLLGDGGGSTDQGIVLGNRYGIARAILPKYETIELYDCGDVAEALRDMRKMFGEEVVEWAPGIWRTPYGLAFEKDDDLEKMREVIARLTWPDEPVS